MPSTENRNPASRYALNINEVRALSVGTTLLVCTLNDYHTKGRITDPLVRRVDGFVSVVFHGMAPRPRTHFDEGTGDWVVLDRDLSYGMTSTIEVRRGWGRASRWAYRPSSLGLTLPRRAVQGLRPSWNEYVCVIRPEAKAYLGKEYPRPVSPY